MDDILWFQDFQDYIDRGLFDETKHPRGKGATGGQFVAKGSSGQNDTVGFDSKRGTGAGYGAKGGDARVKQLQRVLNNLGFKDAAGKPLAVDGKLGPKTTAAIKRLQRKMGIKADGLVTPALLKKLSSVDQKRHVAYKGGAKNTRQAADASLAPAKKAKAPAKKTTAPMKKTAAPAKKVTK